LDPTTGEPFKVTDEGEFIAFDPKTGTEVPNGIGIDGSVRDPIGDSNYLMILGGLLVMLLLISMMYNWLPRKLRKYKSYRRCMRKMKSSRRTRDGNYSRKTQILDSLLPK